MEEQNSFTFSFNDIDCTASIVKSTDLSNDVLIPSYVEHKSKKYKIISIESKAIKDTIRNLKFAEDSHVQIFNESSFQFAVIENLEIPKSLTTIEDGCFFQSRIHNIIVSPENKFFTYIDNKYLLGKSQENLDQFDILLYARSDLTEAVIPPYIKILKKNSFGSSLESLILSEDSEVEIIEYGVLNYQIKEFNIPKKLQKIGYFIFQTTRNLVNIEVSPENENFKYIDDKFLLTKTNVYSDTFDELRFCRRDVVEAIIPNYIVILYDHAFSNCFKMKKLIFEPKSNVKVIDNYCFSWCKGPTTIIFPESVTKINGWSFCGSENISFIEFLGEKLKFDSSCYQLCESLRVASLPIHYMCKFRSVLKWREKVVIKISKLKH